MEILVVFLELGRQARTPELAQLTDCIKDCFQADEVIFEIFKFRHNWHNHRGEGGIARFYDALPLVSQLAHRLVTEPKDEIYAVTGLMKRNDIVHLNVKDSLDHAYAHFAKDQAMFWPPKGTAWSPEFSQFRIFSYAGIGHVSLSRR